MLFSDRSISTMVHGVGLGGLALIGLAAAIFHLYAAARSGRSMLEGAKPSRAFAVLMVVTAAAVWLTTLSGTYLVFPPYRAAPPAGLTDLTQFPRALVHANPDTVWVHAFGMEIKEHAPWMASMLATAVAFVAVRHRSRIFGEPLRQMALTFLAISLALVCLVALLGVFANKVAPLQ